MEAWKEEIEENKPLYFRAKASFKYRGKLDQLLRETTGEEEYIHEAYYDVEIHNPEQISASAYKNRQTVLELSGKYQNVRVFHQNQVFDLEPIKLFLVEDREVEHQQKEGMEIHGSFVDVEVIFMVHRVEKKVVCRQEFPTGRYEMRGDKKWIEYYYRDCTTYWLPEGLKCIQDDPTGKREIRGEKVWAEYYNFDCTTYWKELCDKCIQDQPTGREEKRTRAIYAEYYNADCTTYWKLKEAICTQGAQTGRYRVRGQFRYVEYYNKDCSTYWEKERLRGEEGWGCIGTIFEYIRWIFMGFISALPMLISLGINSPIPMFFGYGLPLVWWLLSQINKRIPKFGDFFLKLANSFMSILLAIMVLVILGTALSMLKKLYAPEQKRARVVVDRSNDKTSVERIKTDSTREKIKVDIQWGALDHQTYAGSYYLYADQVDSSALHLWSIKRKSSFGEVYKRIYQFDMDYLDPLYSMLDSIRNENNMSDKRFANVVVSMVQSIEYVLILSKACDDPEVLKDESIREMLFRGIPCQGDSKFGLRTPAQFTTDLKGDCDTRTLLLFTIFKHFGFDVVIINSNRYRHSMLGLAMDGHRGHYKQYQNKKYYFWETTNKGFELGYLGEEMLNLRYWKIVIK